MLQIPETVALVGHTGSGKSSIINVLMRFYEFYEGQILIDDRDIRDFPMTELREKMGLVLQDAFMFYGDIAGNIRLLNPDITDEQIKQARNLFRRINLFTRYPIPIMRKSLNEERVILADNVN